MNPWTISTRSAAWAVWACLALVVPSPLAADDKGPPPELVPIAPNAAVVYWHAFSHIPNLNEADRKLLDTVTTEPHAAPTEEGKKLLDRYTLALAEFQRAGAIRVCDWNLDYSLGAELTLPHLQKSRDLCRVALARASYRVSQGRTDDAVGDIVAVFQAARHAGSSPVLIALLVDVAMESMATRVVARHLPRLSPAQAERLAEQLDSLPSACTIAVCLRCEGVYFSEWIARKIREESANSSPGEAALKLAGGLSELKPGSEAEAAAVRKRLSKLGNAVVDGWLERLREDYAAIARISALAPAERMERLNAFEVSLANHKQAAVASGFATPEQQERLISMLMLPAAAKVAEKDAKHRALIDLLRAAISARAADRRLPAEGQIPGVGPVTRRDCADMGYELAVTLPGAAGTVSLIVGEGCPAITK